MKWVHWWNTTRLHEALDYQTPTEVEASHHMTGSGPEPRITIGTEPISSINQAAFTGPKKRSSLHDGFVTRFILLSGADHVAGVP